ncbi:MAG: VTT domain-containing protein, partial [Kiritimatiellae bacterium]|nr:VTT domain-containing protein [Kiritimatiellia bacterium]
LLATLILALILIPFVLFGTWIEEWTVRFIETAREHRLLSAAVLGGLLAGDVVLPTPSSLISTACGLLLGGPLGTLTSLLGMSISCTLGYALGRFGRTALRNRMLSETDLVRLEHLYQRTGDWLVVITRPVPVLAEAAVIVAGMGRMPFARFLLLSTLSNLGISLVYALVGAFSADSGAFFWSFAGAILLPLAALLLMKRSVVS